jgi:hypothetical protein
VNDCPMPVQRALRRNTDAHQSRAHYAYDCLVHAALLLPSMKAFKHSAARRFSSLNVTKPVFREEGPALWTSRRVTRRRHARISNAGAAGDDRRGDADRSRADDDASSRREPSSDGHPNNDRHANRC